MAEPHASLGALALQNFKFFLQCSYFFFYKYLKVIRKEIEVGPPKESIDQCLYTNIEYPIIQCLYTY